MRPELECGQCAKRLAANGEIPLCRTAEGCPIEAEAKDTRVHRLISGYLRYKELNACGAAESIQMQALEQVGAHLLCPDFILAMEPVHKKFIEAAQEEYRKKKEQEKAHKEAVARAKEKAKKVRAKLGRG